MISEISDVQVNAVYACAAFVGTAVGIYGLTRGVKILSGGVKCLAAASLAGSLIVGGMVVTSVHIVGAKTNDTQQVSGELSSTNEVGQVGGDAGTNGVEQVGADDSETNAPPNLLGRSLFGLRLGSQSPTVSFITDDDIAAGWRVVSMSSNVLVASTFTMPEGATVWESAQACGRGWGAWHIPIGGWNFTYGDVGWTNGFVWVEGCFRSKFRSRANEIRLLSDRLALCPAAHWSRYNLAASRAWCATNDVDGLMVTFENAAIGDDPTKIASVQMELFPYTGEVALRYDLANVGDATYTAGLVVNGTNLFVEVGAGTREVVFQRVHPDDWDMDGIPNGMDDDPRVAAANAGWNQSDAWAMLAFPSNAAEIAAAGYAAWAKARAADSNRRLVGLRVSSASGSWPILLTFGGLQVMCDGKQELVFAIDCGAHYPFSISDGGKLEFLALHADVDDVLSCFAYGYPYERWAGDVVAHLDSPSSGWIGRTAEVTVEGLDGSHFFPDDSTTVTAVVTNCHEDAYVSCTWSGGEGFSFADAHSLSTTVCWNGDEVWATNYVTCVTTYEGGYAVTNSQAVTVGGSDEPPLRLSMTGQDVYFLNDYDNGNRTERVYRVSFELQGPRGTTGNLSVESVGGAEMKFFFEKGLHGPATNSIPMSIGEDAYSCTTNLYLACPELGRGTVVASFRSDGGGTVSTSRTCRVIEPLRRFVTNETYPNSRQYVNPSCLVYGTNAVLKVDVRTGIGGEFGADEMDWVKISGPCSCVTNGWYLEVTPTSTNGLVEIEARFNEDVIQPRFILPIVCPRELAVKAFMIEPDFAGDCIGDDEGNSNLIWTESELRARLDEANHVFAQCGVRFRLDDIIHVNDRPGDWEVAIETVVTNGNRTCSVLSEQAKSLMTLHPSNSCIAIYCVGEILPRKYKGGKTDYGVLLPRNSSTNVLAHELGHVVGLKDCFSRTVAMELMVGGDLPVQRGLFKCDGEDWGEETGRGFYPLGDDVESTLASVLMFGYDKGGKDVPANWIKALWENEILEERVREIPVGAHFLELDNGKVYSK